MNKPYDIAAILRQNVADLEMELRRQRERAEKAEAELKAAREQEPVAIVEYSDYQTVSALVGDEPKKIAVRALFDGALRIGENLYARPIPAAPAVLNGEQDELIEAGGCAPGVIAVPAPEIPDGDDFNGTTPHMIQCIESLVNMSDRGVLAPHGLCGHSRTLLLASANRLRQQAAPAVPEDMSVVRDLLAALKDVTRWVPYRDWKYSDEPRLAVVRAEFVISKTEDLLGDS